MRSQLTRCTPVLARIVRLALLGVLSAGSLAAYTVHLKDGTSIVTKKKYTAQGDKAILTLPSGTETTMALAEIDFFKTEAANRSDLGNAIVIEDGKATDLTHSAPPPRAMIPPSSSSTIVWSSTPSSSRAKARCVVRPPA